MHLVAALDRVPDVRGVLTLFEGVASGAADGYARMADDPAATLLHLGPGFGNAFANVHNAYKARTPMVNLVGDHAVAHKPLGAPLASDIESVARPASHWLRTARDARSAATRHRRGGRGGARRRRRDADPARRRGLGAERSGRRRRCRCPRCRRCRTEAVEAARAGAALRRARRCCWAARRRGERGLALAARIAAATGARLFRDTFRAAARARRRAAAAGRACRT